jgi:hypothetical protein
MIVGRSVVRRFGDLIEKAERSTIEDMKKEAIEQETSVTDRFLVRVQDVVNEYGTFEGIEFRARTLGERGPRSAEKKYGADFCGVLHVKFPDFQLSKGFLSQAKNANAWVRVNAGYRGATRVDFSPGSEFTRLQDQTDKMLAITPDSVVIVYSMRGFVVVPASSVRSLKTKNQLYGKNVKAFFKEYLMCFIGDTRIIAYDDKTLESVRAETNSRTAILFKISKI